MPQTILPNVAVQIQVRDLGSGGSESEFALEELDLL